MSIDPRTRRRPSVSLVVCFLLLVSGAAVLLVGVVLPARFIGSGVERFEGEERKMAELAYQTKPTMAQRGATAGAGRSGETLIVRMPDLAVKCATYRRSMDGGSSRLDSGRVRKRGAEGLGTLLRFWFGPKPFERSGELYERLGVRRFTRFLPFGYHANRLVRALGARRFRVVGDRKSAMVWVLFTMVAEALHSLAFAVFVTFMVLDLLDGEYGRAAANLLLNLSVNAYPLMAQRYTRIRLLRAFRLDLGDAGRWDI